MAQGLEVYGADGALRSGVTSRLTRVIGTRSVTGSGTLSWPYPGVSGKWHVLAFSNMAWAANQVSTAYAYLDTSSVVHYSQEDDQQAITLVFLAF